MFFQFVDKENTLFNKFIWLLAFVCVIPGFIHLTGLSFGIFEDTSKFQLSGEFLYVIFQWTIFCIAMFTSILALVHYRITGDSTGIVIGLTFFCGGVMTCFSVLAAKGLFVPVSDKINFLPLAWTLGRLGKGLILTAAAVHLLCFNQELDAETGKKTKRISSSSLFLMVTIICLSSYAVILSISKSQYLPDSISSGGLVSRRWDLLPLFVFVFAGVFVLSRFYERHPNILSLTLFLSIIPEVASQAYMAFGSYRFFDYHFVVSHFLEFVAYTVPLLGLGINYNRSYSGIEKVNEALVNKIRERDEIEYELHKLSRAIEYSPNAVFITDRDGMIEYANPKYTELTDYSQEEVLGTLARILRPKKNRLKEQKLIWKTISAGDIWKGDFLTKKKNEERYWEHVLISSIKDKNDQITNYVIVAEDITQRKKAQAELRKAAAIKDDFISIVSHELRTPLAISKEALSLMLRGKVGNLSKKQLEVTSMASSNIDRLTFLINDILDISKIEAGKMEIRKDPVDIIPLVTEFFEGWKLRAKSEKIAFSLIAPYETLTINLDKARLQEILSNLLSNATKFTPEKGTVMLSILDQETEVEFSVKDTGPGIPKEEINSIFDKFQQIGRTHGPGTKGTGLGLSIVKSLVQMHGGKIWVNSTFGEGTTFFFTIPKMDKVKSMGDEK